MNQHAAMNIVGASLLATRGSFVASKLAPTARPRQNCIEMRSGGPDQVRGHP